MVDLKAASPAAGNENLFKCMMNHSNLALQSARYKKHWDELAERRLY